MRRTSPDFQQLVHLLANQSHFPTISPPFCWSVRSGAVESDPRLISHIFRQLAYLLSGQSHFPTISPVYFRGHSMSTHFSSAPSGHPQSRSSGSAAFDFSPALASFALVFALLLVMRTEPPGHPESASTEQGEWINRVLTQW